jgi:hypothetical protein
MDDFQPCYLLRLNIEFAYCLWHTVVCSLRDADHRDGQLQHGKGPRTRGFSVDFCNEATAFANTASI